MSLGQMLSRVSEALINDVDALCDKKGKHGDPWFELNQRPSK